MAEHSYRENMKNRDRSSKEIGKMYEKINENEKRSSMQKLRVRAVCCHRQDSNNPSLIPMKKDNNGVTMWICRHCHEKIDLRLIPEAKLDDAIATITDACNLIKITASRKDSRLIEEVISDLQYKLNGFLKGAYMSAVSNSKRRKNDNGGNGYRSKAGTTFYVND